VWVSQAARAASWRRVTHEGDGLEVGVEDALEHELHPLHALDLAVLRSPERCDRSTARINITML